MAVACVPYREGAANRMIAGAPMIQSIISIMLEVDDEKVV